MKGEFEEFYGLRDFFNMIKMVIRNLAKSEQMDQISVLKIIKRAFERNFGGSELFGINASTIIQ